MAKNERWNMPENENMQQKEEIYPRNISPYMEQGVKYGNVELTIINQEYGLYVKNAATLEIQTRDR